MPVNEMLQSNFHSKIHPKLLHLTLGSQDYLARMTHIKRSLDADIYGDADVSSMSEGDMVHLGNISK